MGCHAEVSSQEWRRTGDGLLLIEDLNVVVAVDRRCELDDKGVTALTSDRGLLDLSTLKGG